MRDIGDVPKRRQHELHEVVAGAICAILAVTGYGLITPATVEFVNFTYEDLSPYTGVDWLALAPVVGIVIAAAGLGGLAWILLVERRRPRRPSLTTPGGHDRPAFLAFLVVTIVQPLSFGRWDELSNIYRISGRDDLLFHVTGPNGLVRAAVAFLAILIGVYVVGRAVEDVWRHRRPAASTSATATQQP